MSQYALLSSDKTTVLNIAEIDPTVYATWVSNSNPKASSYLPVNMIAKPSFDAATQFVTQTGWTITGVDVQPIWSVQTLNAAGQFSVAATTEWNNLLAGNVVGACNTFLAIPTPSAAQNAQAIQLLVKFVRAYAKSQIGISN